MSRYRVSWGIGLMALLLALGTVACGSDEPAAVTPPAPPPAPPPFQPQPVEVALGESGTNITLMTTESGGFTLNGEAFSGGEVTAENGNMYNLTLADGKWTAAYQAMESMVTLGITEEKVTLVKAEDGSYWLGDQAFASGGTAMASNGNTYMLTLGDDGMWMAQFVPAQATVMLGELGGTVMITTAEDGSYWLGDMGVQTGSTTMANGNTYMFTQAEDGSWTAAYVPATGSVAVGGTGVTVPATRNEAGMWMATNPLTGEAVTLTEGGTVMVGMNRYTLSSDGAGMWTAAYDAHTVAVMLAGTDEMVTLVRAEDGSYWLGDMEVTSGETTVTATTRGNMYTLVMDMDGMWSANYINQETVIPLGSSGDMRTIVRAADGSYWLGDMELESGDMTTAENGKMYSLNLADGAWSAMFEPVTMEIMGTGGLMASSREADDMYDVSNSSSTLPASGAGDITTNDGAMYRVSMMDSMLSGVRFDGAPKGDTVFITVGLDNPDLDPDAEVTYIADDRDTAFNEANTKVTIAGENISLGDLLGSGSAMKAAAASDGLPGEFVKSAVDVLMDLLTEAELYAKYQATATDDAGRSAFDGRLNNIAERAQGAVNMIFGTNAAEEGVAEADIASKVNIVSDGVLPTEPVESATDYIRATQTVRGLNRLLDALSSADAFVAATKDGNNGVFEDALGEDAARDAFSANKSEYMVYFGTTANTRYGAIALKERASGDFTRTVDGTATEVTEAAAVHGTRFQYDGATAGNTTDNVEVGKVGAFSYATVNDTLRARNLLQTGGAVYEGGTVAATPAGTLYSGDMRIDVNFRQQSVFGRVSRLTDKDNNLWKYLDSDVDTIYLPRQNYNNQAQFGGLSTGNEDVKRGGTGEFGMATVVYSQSQGFSTTPTEQPTNARFAGRFIGTDGGEITGTWSLGQPVEGEADPLPAKSNDLDVIFGSYGVTRQDSSGPVGPSDLTGGGRVKTTAVLPGTDATVTPATLGVTIAGDEDAAGILRLGKRSTGGGEDVDNDFALTRIFARPGADPKTTTINSPTHVSVVVDHIMAQRAIYVIYAEQVGGDSADITDLANVGRQNAWKSINDFVRDHIFDVAAIAPTGTGTGGAVVVTDVTEVQNLSSPLGTYFYPMTRNGRPDDDAALDQIDRLLAAFADKYAFADAVADDGGGVFDSQPALDSGGAGTADPFPLDTVDDVTDAGYSAEPTGDIFGRISSQTKLFSLSTAYTRFGVWSRRETESAVADWENHGSPDDGADTPADTGATSPGSYAYSYLEQSTYRVDRPVATYPSNGLATYEGKTLVNMGNTQAWTGDALIRVNWSPLDTTGATPVATSTIVPIFSNFERWDDKSFDRLVHGADTDNRIVDEIAFRASGGGALTLTHDGEKLGISVTDAAVEVVYTDGTSITTLIANSTFNGKFVGSSGDGPLGVLGTWKVPGFRGATSTANDLTGSFGADLTSFETPLP